MTTWWQNSWLRSAALVLLCLALYLPGQSALPPFDRDEARFAQASHQMVESGNYIDIRFQEQTRYKKPIAIYWLQSASAKITGAADQIWAYRVPSWLAAMLAVLTTSFIGARFFSPLAGLLAGAMLASCLLLGVEARMAKTDAVLLSTIVVSQYVLMRLWIERTLSPRLAVLYWVALGAGILVKGPIIMLVTGLTMAVLSIRQRSAAWLRSLQPHWGLPLCALIVLPWLIAITIKSHGAFWQESVGQDLISKAVSEQESHGSPPGYYFVTAFLTLWPWSALLLPAGFYAWRQRYEPKVQFLLAWAVPFWLLFEIFPTKLMHYTLPVFPALLLLCAALVTDAQFTLSPLLRRMALGLAGLLLVVVGAGVPLAPAYLFPVLMPMSVIALGAGLLLVAGGVVAFGLYNRRPALAAGIVLVTLTNFYAAVYAQLLPNMDGFWVSRSAAQLVAPYRSACPGPVASLGYTEPSLVFLLGTDTMLASEMPPPPATGCRLLLLDQQHVQPGTAASALGAVHGFNYSRGRETTLYLLKQQAVSP